MNLLVIGATGGTGKEVVKQALELGYNVSAFSRHPENLKIKNPNLQKVKGDVLNYESVKNAVKSKDAVISTLGHKKWFFKNKILSDGTKNIISTMEENNVKRFVCETTLGIGDQRGKLGLYYTLFVIPVITFFYFKDKELQEKYIRESNLDWVIVRPGQLTNGKKRSNYKHGFKIGNYITTVTISRADVAEFMLKQLTDDTYLKAAPAIAN